MEAAAKKPKKAKNAVVEVMIVPDLRRGNVNIFQANGKDEHEASERAQKLAFEHGWNRTNCSAYGRAIKPYYKGYCISRRISLW